MKSWQCYEKAEDAAKLLDRIKKFCIVIQLFAPTIEDYANQVESDKTIEAGNHSAEY